MSKQSKITVKHYLEKKVKPEIENGIERYPLFVIIIYNRMIIRRKSNIYTKYSLEEFENLNLNENKAINHEIKLIFKIVELFVKQKDKGQLTTKFLNFSSRNSYKSKNQDLNILNSYIYFYCYFIDDILYTEFGNNLRNHIEDKLKTIFIFNDNTYFKDALIDTFDDLIIFNWKDESSLNFILDNFSIDFIKTFFMNQCFTIFANFYTKTTGDNYGIPYFVWHYENSEIKKEYKNFILKNKEVKKYSQKMSIDIDTELIESHFKFIDNIVFAENYVEKYKS